ncbi:uncharacterized protein LOC126783893 [Argentina anserina]|uniref:uncharacterized protein LOC126783893 n=1 Tax=Argentina anserina TaxID=57926 RepID=UPI00217623C1|nr:uncharacterized protein LOC126783893 [Potentilla anserina]
MATFEDFEFVQFDQDSDLESLWEFIDISDADSATDHSDVTIATTPIASPATDPTRAQTPRRQTRLVRVLDLPFQTPLRCGLDDNVDDVSGEEEEEEEEDGYGLDDELVPWSVSEKLGRERMRKLGKRTFAKMQSSKRSSLLVVRPGCVRGKHGLGLKHIY